MVTADKEKRALMEKLFFFSLLLYIFYVKTEKKMSPLGLLFEPNQIFFWILLEWFEI